MTRLIDADDIVLDYSGLANISPLDFRGTAEYFTKQIDAMPTIEPKPERKKGKWVEKHHAYSDEGFAIEEWQSCRCSECGRYDTRPYMYYFDEPNYCSYCGADMRGEEE